MQAADGDGNLIIKELFGLLLLLLSIVTRLSS
jgi:hypothetical protein